MNMFNLPARTSVNRSVPKNAFDKYTNSKQKKSFTHYIQSISWTNKLSKATVNLSGKDIEEIQIFKIELKQKIAIPKLLEIIDRAIPYYIIFWLEYDGDAYISTAAKHPHPTNDDIAVIDRTFISEWFKIDNKPYVLNLKGTLDAVFKNLCVQLIERSDLEKESMNSILKNQQEEERLKKKIDRLKSAISKSNQFNEKVDLNIKLKMLETQLNRIQGS
ncbi:MAG: DUF4391 domain-containing protein [Bacteroidales bacterium]